MYGCESWAIKKIESRRTGSFKLCFWRRLLRVPWTARRSNQSILKEISPEYSLERLSWSRSFNIWPPDAKSWLIGKDPDAEKDSGQEEKGATEYGIVGWHHCLNRHECEQTLGEMGLQSMGLQRTRHGLATVSHRKFKFNWHPGFLCDRPGNSKHYICIIWFIWSSKTHKMNKWW